VSDTWKSLIDAAFEAYSTGRIPEAEVQFKAALEEAEKFGEEDPRLALTLNNLAAMYHEQGKFTMAEPLYKRSLDIKTRTLGDCHADVALNHHNLAVLYSARRMYPVAEKHYKLALEMKEKLYGSHHQELLSTLGYYAQLMKVQNRLVDRQLIESRIKEINEQLKPAAVEAGA
jgi:tetratricopeptide (TPR) repeat protein